MKSNLTEYNDIKENSTKVAYSSDSFKNIQIANNVPIVEEKADILYEQVEYTDLDIDYDFQIQTNSYNNSLIELANPVLALALRVKKISQLNDVPKFYKRIQNEIIAISEKVKMLNYNSAIQLSFRYCLCTFVDEIIMATPWGSNSIWGERSLLAYFHNETWGGEKFYTILQRTMLEPEQYRELLEFMYICLALGFKGKYALDPNGKENIQNHMIKLQKELRVFRGYDYDSDNQIHLYEKDYTIKKNISVKYLIWIIVGCLLFIYFVYSMILDSYSSDIINNINSILE